MEQRIGYYVHHQGRGHLDRALAIARHAPERFVLLGTGLAGQTGEIPAVELAPDLPDARTTFDNFTERSSSLHYAPLGNAGIRSRTASLAAWIGRVRPGLVVCDVSVEIAMLARLTSTPCVYVRLNGDRTDPAHYEAFRNAQMLLAPFHPALDDPQTPAWVRRKTVYFPGICSARAKGCGAGNIILVVNGAGGAMLDGEAIAAAARATPAFRWRSIGPVCAPQSTPENLALLGWVGDAAAEIANATVVVGAAGDGLVGAVLAAARPFLCIPQARPFNEQHMKAARLHALGAAIALLEFPPAASWPALIELALTLDVSRAAALHDPDGAKKAFDFLTSGFCRNAPPCRD